MAPQASGATKYESQEVGLKYMADVKKEVVDERAQVCAAHGHTRPRMTLLLLRACGALGPRPSPRAPRPSPRAATADATTANFAPYRSSPLPHGPQVAALGKLLGIDCEALSKAEPSP